MQLVLGRVLEGIVIVLMVVLAVEVLLGVTYRKMGNALVWYDEIASITLAWLTYYGAALAALRGAHIGVPELVAFFPRPVRIALACVAKLLSVTFIGLMSYAGWMVLEVLATDMLVSLPEVPVSYTQSVIPIGGALFLLAELLHFPEAIEAARRGGESTEPEVESA